MFGGDVRKRLPCTRQDLQQLAGTAAPAVIDKALNLVASVNLDDRHFEDVVRFGAQLQSQHGALMEKELAFMQNPELAQAQGLHAQILRAIEAADPDLLFSSQNRGLRGALKSLGLGRADPEDIFTAQFGKLAALAQDLKKREPALSALDHQLAKLAAQFDHLLIEVQAHILAANFITAHVRKHHADRPDADHYVLQANTLENRVGSLLATRLSLESGRVTHNLLGDAVHGMLHAGHELMEEGLPAFHTAFVTAITHARLTPDTSHLQHLRIAFSNILKQLKTGDSRHGKIQD